LSFYTTEAKIDSLTGFLQSRYNEYMDPEGTTALLEGTPEQVSSADKKKRKMLDIREEFRNMQYSEEVLKYTKDKLPDTVGELREALDKRAGELIQDNERSEAEHKKNVPDRVLRDEDERGWMELGWSESDRKRVKDKIRQRLKLDENRAENLLHMLIASGKTPGDVIPLIEDDAKWDYYYSDQEGKNKVTFIVGGDGRESRHPLAGNPDGARRYLYLKNTLGLTNEANEMNEVYLERFVLDDDFRANLDHEYDNNLPQNLFDLAWNIMYHNPKKYGVNGEFPVLQMQVRNNSGEPVNGRYVVNQANMIRWLRDRMFYRYDAFETDDVPDYYSVITIPKGQFATVNLATMIFDESRYFTDETGYKWDDLYNSFFIEPFDLIFDRTYAIEHQKAYDKGDDFHKAWENWARLSKFTRKINGQSMVDRSMMLALDSSNGPDNDTKVGEAILAMFLTYYNLADFKGLQNVLGEESEFFTREAWVKAASDFAGKGTAGTGGIKASGMINTGDFFGIHQEYFDKAFNKEGKVTEKTMKDFLLFINPNWHEFPPQNIEKVLAQMVQNAVSDKFKSKQGTKDAKGEDPIDTDSLKYAWLKAYSWIGFTGARARNNFKPSGEPSGHHQETRLIHTDAYRMKYENFGGAGNRFTVPMFKQLSIPFFEGTLSENGITYYFDGYDKEGKPQYKKRNKTQMEVMLELRQIDLSCEREVKALEAGFKSKIAQVSSKTEKDRLEKEFERRRTEIEDKYKYYHKLGSGELEFNDNAMLVYAKNMIGMANPLYDRIMKAKETDFSKFITYDGIFRGPTFNQEAWQDALQSKLFTPLRYIFEANGGTQLNQRVRAPVYLGRDSKNKAMWEWREQYMGERMIGHQVLDIKDFWMDTKSIPKEELAERKRKGYRIRRGYIIRPDGKHEIDYNKAQNNKPMVYKQWMLMKLAADLWSHIDKTSTDPGYTLEHYENIVQAIKDLPGDMAGDEYDMNGVRITKTLFSKHQIEWLERISGKNKLAVRTFWSDIFIGDKRKKESLFGESVSTLLGAVFKGYG
jgi:hypothetical protein